MVHINTKLGERCAEGVEDDVCKTNCQRKGDLEYDRWSEESTPCSDNRAAGICLLCCCASSSTGFSEQKSGEETCTKVLRDMGGEAAMSRIGMLPCVPDESAGC